MVDANQALLLRTTGHDVSWWAHLARGQNFRTAAELAAWLRDEHDVTGYSQTAVVWEVFGYPKFMLQSADELLAGQYSDREHLRPIADALLAWADRTEGVAIQLRAGYVSLQSPRRKFAQITPATKSAVDVALRWLGAPQSRLEPLRVRADDPFAWRVRLRSLDDVDDEVFALLADALDQNR